MVYLVGVIDLVLLISMPLLDLRTTEQDTENAMMLIIKLRTHHVMHV